MKNIYIGGVQIAKGLAKYLCFSILVFFCTKLKVINDLQFRNAVLRRNFLWLITAHSYDRKAFSLNKSLMLFFLGECSNFSKDQLIAFGTVQNGEPDLKQALSKAMHEPESPGWMWLRDFRRTEEKINKST